MDLSPPMAGEVRSATPVATLRRFANARRTNPARAQPFPKFPLATCDRALEQLLPAPEPTEVPV